MAATPPVPAAATLEVREKVAVVYALMTQDRAEIREQQGAVFKLTNFVITAFAAIAVFADSHPALLKTLTAAQTALALLYVVAFFTFWRWLRAARAYLSIREAFLRTVICSSLRSPSPCAGWRRRIGWGVRGQGAVVSVRLDPPRRGRVDFHVDAQGIARSRDASMRYMR